MTFFMVLFRFFFLSQITTLSNQLCFVHLIALMSLLSYSNQATLLSGESTNVTVRSSLKDDKKILSFADHTVELVTNTSYFQMKGGHDGTYLCFYYNSHIVKIVKMRKII